MEATKQMSAWAGQFGQAYTDRNAVGQEEMEEIYRRQFGATRTAINERFVGAMDRTIRILEVGANVGNQLRCLQRMGFENLYGIELQWYAVRQALERTDRINLIQGTAFDLPFKDEYFDLVYTSGVLIHLAPDDLPRALAEIHRCSRAWIWGFEYYSDTFEEVKYRGHEQLMWKADYSRIYREAFPDLTLVQEEKFSYCDSDNVDACFLLRKERVAAPAA